MYFSLGTKRNDVQLSLKACAHACVAKNMLCPYRNCTLGVSACGRCDKAVLQTGQTTEPLSCRSSSCCLCSLPECLSSLPESGQHCSCVARSCDGVEEEEEEEEDEVDEEEEEEEGKCSSCFSI